MKSLFVFILAVAAAAALGGRSRPDEWFAALARPAWAPPNWLFAPVWSALYVCIALAGWYLWRSEGGKFSLPITLWIVQLLLNAAWTWIFFHQHRIGLALVNILTLFACIVAFIILARLRNLASAWLFVPYALWVGFASLLNGAYWVLNKK